MAPPLLSSAIARLPAGRWGVGVSGGADSVALLLLLRERADLQLHIVHLDHETREGESALDAQFVSGLAKSLGIPCTIDHRSTIEAALPAVAPNPSNRFRIARFALFRRVVAAEKLSGVVLAHHGNDQAETILMRVLRGSSIENLRGIQPESLIDGLKIMRPLLDVRASHLRDFLNDRGQAWREDLSNHSDTYQRNRVRKWFASRPDLRESLFALGNESNLLRHWLDKAAPILKEEFTPATLSSVSASLAQHAAARWLMDRGATPGKLNRKTCDRFIQMATDAASPARQHFPGQILVGRNKGIISVLLQKTEPWHR